MRGMETWEPSQHSFVDTGKPRKTCVEVACRRTFRILTSSQKSGITNFVFLQFSGNRLWYYRKVTPGSVDSGFRCVGQRYASPKGNTRISPITIWAVDIR